MNRRGNVDHPVSEGSRSVLTVTLRAFGDPGVFADMPPLGIDDGRHPSHAALPAEDLFAAVEPALPPLPQPRVRAFLDMGQLEPTSEARPVGSCPQLHHVGIMAAG